MVAAPTRVSSRTLAPLPTGNPVVRIPTLADVYAARQVIDRVLPRTPLLQPPALAAQLGCDIYLKAECLQPVGAFKVRGGVHLLSHLSDEERARGLVTASTGNHGQSIAWAARQAGARAVIHVPARANPLKVASMERFGATVVQEGPDFDASVALAMERAEREGMTFVHSANDWRLIAGVATYTLEILEAVPDLDVLVVPVGAGSGLCGALIAGKTIKPDLKVIGVQAEGAPAFYASWRARELLTYDRAATFAEGMATRVAFELPAHIIWDRVDDMRLVSEADLRRAIVQILETAWVLAEGAGAAAVAAIHQMRDELAGKKVAAVVSGGNLTMDGLKQALEEERR